MIDTRFIHEAWSGHDSSNSTDNAKPTVRNRVVLVFNALKTILTTASVLVFSCDEDVRRLRTLKLLPDPPREASDLSLIPPTWVDIQRKFFPDPRMGRPSLKNLAKKHLESTSAVADTLLWLKDNGVRDSNWELRPLKGCQRVYAALDAYILFELDRVMSKDYGVKEGAVGSSSASSNANGASKFGSESDCNKENQNQMNINSAVNTVSPHLLVNRPDNLVSLESSLKSNEKPRFCMLSNEIKFIKKLRAVGIDTEELPKSVIGKPSLIKPIEGRTLLVRATDKQFKGLFGAGKEGENLQNSQPPSSNQNVIVPPYYYSKDVYVMTTISATGSINTNKEHLPAKTGQELGCKTGKPTPGALFLDEVLRVFKITLSREDLLSRCSICNTADWRDVLQEEAGGDHETMVEILKC